MKSESLLGLALGCIFVALSGQWFWSSVFRQEFPVAESVFALVIGASLIFAFSIMILRVSPGVVHALRGVMLLVLIFLVYRIARPYLGGEAVSTLVKMALVVMALLLAMGAVFKGRRANWGRFCAATIAFSAIFIASFPLAGMSQRKEGNAAFGLSFLAHQNDQPENVVLLLLDELSPESTGLIVDALRRQNTSVYATDIAAAGFNTINAIPAMLTGQRFDYSMPCGAALLCSDGKSLDFSSLRVAGRAVDIIGILPSYCAIQGLRSCVSIHPEAAVPALQSLVCDLLRSFLVNACNSNPASERRKEIAASRKHVEQSIMTAPFWENGGLLFAHVLLPHPVGLSPNISLEKEYQANLVESARLASQILERLNARFKNNFVFVLTSDHPLRVDFYCSVSAYSSENCKTGLPENRGRVPLIVVSPKPIRAPVIKSAVGLLAG